jgi:hypothetical protein
LINNLTITKQNQINNQTLINKEYKSKQFQFGKEATHSKAKQPNSPSLTPEFLTTMIAAQSSIVALCGREDRGSAVNSGKGLAGCREEIGGAAINSELGSVSG